ncbi:MAG TPA: SRPBCC domain-containing protein [Kofleriaceae bacterium]
MKGDKATVMVTVPVPPNVAFDVFTQETDLWWRRGVRYRVAGRHPGTLAFEPKLGGRLFEQYEGPAGTRTHEAGRITIWDPPGRLEFEWRGSNFAPGETTHVLVTFASTESGGTQVTVEHRGFAALRPDHPVRHGEEAAAFIRRMGLWWGDLMSGLRVHVTPD